MNIYVCVKHVPDTAANIKVVGEAGFDESVKYVMNPYDEYAVEEAVQIVERVGGEVVIVSVGRETAINTIRSALAVGGNRGILVKTDDLLLDSATTAMALKTAIVQDGKPDLIITGKQSVDTEGMQTHYRLAAALDLPVANEVVSFAIEDTGAVVECEAGSGDREVVALDLPCVIGAAKGLNEPRYPKLPHILKAKKKEVRQIDIGDLLSTPTGGTSKLVALEPVPERGAAEMIEGAPREVAEMLVRRLREDAKVL